MKNLIEHKSEVIEMFKKFLNCEISELELIADLSNLEKEIWKSNDGTITGNLWFKFFKSDVLSCTIDDIFAELKSNDRQYMLNNFILAIESDQLEIYYTSNSKRMYDKRYNL